MTRGPRHTMWQQFDVNGALRERAPRDGGARLTAIAGPAADLRRAQPLLSGVASLLRPGRVDGRLRYDMRFGREQPALSVLQWPFATGPEERFGVGEK